MRGKLRISGAIDSTAKAMRIGQAGRNCTNFTYSFIEDLYVGDFSGTETLILRECRKLHFERLTVRGGQLLIEAITNNSFCGDMIFDALEITTSSLARRSMHIRAYAAASAAEVRGLRFNQPTFYGSSYLVEAGGYGRFGDIWFNSPQFDQGIEGERAITFQTSGASARGFGVHLDNPYFGGYAIAVAMLAGAADAIFDIMVDGAQLTDCTANDSDFNGLMIFSNVRGVSVTNSNAFLYSEQPANSSMLKFISAEDFVVTGNISNGPESIPRGIDIDSNCDHFTIIGNRIQASSQQVANASSAIDQIVANNRA